MPGGFGDGQWGFGHFGDPLYNPPVNPDVEYGTVPPPEAELTKKVKQWKVVHYRHDGQALGEVFPSSPEFAMYLGKTGYLNYDMDMDSPLARKQNTEPYATDYALMYGDRVLQGGMHTDIEISEIEGHTLKVSGKDWFHWFEKQQWPFDPNDPLANVYSAFNRDLFLIMEDWFTVIQSLPNTIQFTYANGLSGATTNAKIDVADTEDMMSKFTTLSQATPGFDIEITPDKQIKLWYPKKTRQNDMVLEQGINIYQLSYHNKGPNATHTVAQAQLPSSKAGLIIDSSLQSKYRRLSASSDFGSLPDQTSLNSLATGEAQRNETPGLEFTCRIIPEFIDDIFEVIELGDQIVVVGELGWDYVNQSVRLVSITGGPNDEGDQEFELGFDDGTLSL
jgi:hypothetical protein